MSNYKNHFQSLLILVLVCLLPSSSGLADIVILKNGRSFEGLIKQETPKSITLNIGLGTITIKRKNISSFQYLESDNQLQAQWQKKYATETKYVPPHLKSLAGQYKALNSAHLAAKKAKWKNKSLQKSRSKKFKKIATLKEDYVYAAEQLNNTPRNQQNIQRYNQLVAQQNQLNNTIAILSTALEKETIENKANRQIVSDYLDSLSAFETTFNDKQQENKNKPKDKKADILFTEIARHLNGFTTEFKNIPIAHERRANHFFVNVRINNQLTGRFMLDTGASYITLSPKMLKQLGLKTSKHFSTQVTLADGIKQDAFLVMLDSVQVGEAKVKQVLAIVLPKASDQDFEGLLGMSFLKEFIIQLNPSNDTFVLKKFEP